MNHSELSASGSERWLNCPASVKLSRDVPPLPDSKAALEGTRAHDLLEMWIRFSLRNPGQNILIKGYDAEMVSAVRGAVEFIFERHDPPHTDLIAEEKISLEFIHPSMFGTADVQIVEHFGKLQVWDYKHGIGKVVDILDEKKKGFQVNSQLAYYALGVAAKFDFDFSEIEVGIIQPRAKHYKSKNKRLNYYDPHGNIRSVVMTRSELKKYIDHFKRGVDRVFKKNPEIVPGSWCWFCPAKPVCPSYVEKRANAMFGDSEIELAFFENILDDFN